MKRARGWSWRNSPACQPPWARRPVGRFRLENRYAIAEATGISEGNLCKFVHGERGLSLPSIDRLCEHLGLQLVQVANAVKVKVENLIAAKLTGHAPDDETSKWVAQLDDRMADKLARVGLIAPRKRAAPLMTRLGVEIQLPLWHAFSRHYHSASFSRQPSVG